jgi:hypothetical protein
VKCWLRGANYRIYKPSVIRVPLAAKWRGNSWEHCCPQDFSRPPTCSKLRCLKPILRNCRGGYSSMVDCDRNERASRQGSQCATERSRSRGRALRLELSSTRQCAEGLFGVDCAVDLARAIARCNTRNSIRKNCGSVQSNDPQVRVWSAAAGRAGQRVGQRTHQRRRRACFFSRESGGSEIAAREGTSAGHDGRRGIGPSAWRHHHVGTDPDPAIEVLERPIRRLRVREFGSLTIEAAQAVLWVTPTPMASSTCRS